MAEWGKGDQRWIVEDRKDGTNVNSWHWTEKDCVNWSKQRFSELLDGLMISTASDTKAKITGVQSVEGEAFLNVRKKKLIPSYELSITANFEGSVIGSNGEVAVNGKVLLPYIAEENHDEEPEVKVALEQENADTLKLKQAILNEGKQVIIKQVKTFVEEFHAGKPAGHIDDKPTKATPLAQPTSSKAKMNKGITSASADQAHQASRGDRSITIQDSFYASAKDIYEVFTTEGRIKAFTQSEASVKAEVGTPFQMFGGSIEGVQRELVPGKRIVQDWRFNTWPARIYSKVVIELEEPEPGHTKITITQVGIPEEDQYGNRDVVGTTENGWRNLIIHRIKAVFGYGL